MFLGRIQFISHLHKTFMDFVLLGEHVCFLTLKQTRTPQRHFKINYSQKYGGGENASIVGSPLNSACSIFLHLIISSIIYVRERVYVCLCILQLSAVNSVCISVVYFSPFSPKMSLRQLPDFQGDDVRGKWHGKEEL